MSMSTSHILVVAPNWVGDVVMATPAFRSLRAAFGDARIAVAVRKNARPVLDDAPWFDEVIEVSPQEQGIFGTLGLSARLRRQGFDLGVLFTNSFRTALVARLGWRMIAPAS